MTERVYIVTRYRPMPGNPGGFIARTKYEVPPEELDAAFLVTIPPDLRDLDSFDLEVTRLPTANAALPDESNVSLPWVRPSGATGLPREDTAQPPPGGPGPATPSLPVPRSRA